MGSTTPITKSTYLDLLGKKHLYNLKFQKGYLRCTDQVSAWKSITGYAKWIFVLKTHHLNTTFSLKT